MAGGEKLLEGHPFRDIRAQPAGPTTPEVWILGSSDYGAQVAAYFGLPFCFAHFISDGRGVEQALAVYREGYRPSARHPAPACRDLRVGHGRGDPAEEAAYLFRSREMWRLNRDRGLFTALASPEEAATHVLSETERASLDRLRARSFHGTPDAVAGRLNALAAEHGVEEIAILTTLHDPEARRRSYTLLANEMMS